MSVVGNFNYGSYDRQEQQAGAAPTRKMSFSQASQDWAFGSSNQGHEEIEEFIPSKEQRHAEVVQLARQISRQSQRSIPRPSLSRDQHADIQEGGSGGTTTRADSEDSDADIFNYEPGSDLDPYAEHFNIHKWTRAMVNHMAASNDSRVSGIAYRNLSVHGFGSDAGEFRYARRRGTCAQMSLQLFLLSKLADAPRLPEDRR